MADGDTGQGRAERQAAVGAVVYGPELTASLKEEIIDAVRITPRSVEWLVAKNPHWPSSRTIDRWEDEDPEFRSAMKFARRRLADLLAFQAVEIADDGSGDAREVERRDGSTFIVQDQEFAQRSKLRTEVRRWLASKLAPDVYGDRIDANVRLSTVLSQEEALDQLR